ncbi:peptidase A24 [Altererythrobacter soli]|uniref:Peptidase A24 n=1 Tax=Croceibacterium soli TaxID=1739690 RepID=A0A6I4US43_9SPHN|nr:prepilin peptidase [Croceibacterium soli]MXP41611.1 peptidase A24 [Croceibacterium soli]
MSFAFALLPAAVLAAAGAYLDIRHRRLPNRLCAALAVAAAAGLALSAGAGALPWALLHAAIALVIGMLLFALGAIGGGDAKFYAAAALAIPASPVAGPLALLGWTSAAGLVLLITMAVGRRMLGRPGSFLKGWEVPYGVAIAAGFLLTHWLDTPIALPSGVL